MGCRDPAQGGGDSWLGNDDCLLGSEFIATAGCPIRQLLCSTFDSSFFATNRIELGLRRVTSGLPFASK